ncbi:hypothetical protein JN531_003695 [Flagellatimonas centrodinii]|uniref:hypothetical protein n=1 Tax=Flagellatimonas centrodinii TaxID=2806210 RepID=UPI001FED57EC|nr:hypothetical protein [Flagellatimonas centrodinii]ULQ47390.1 hypothetical protein JN531_003695 [Flagellatimonas centrodinii]
MIHLLATAVAVAGLFLFPVSPLLTLLCFAASVPIAKAANRSNVDLDGLFGWMILGAALVGLGALFLG